MPVATVKSDTGNEIKFWVPEGVSRDQIAEMAPYAWDLQQEGVDVLSPREIQRTMGGQVGEFFRGIPRGAIDMLESAGYGASQLATENQEAGIQSLLSKVADIGTGKFQPKPGYEDSMAGQIGAGLGSTVPFLAAGAMGPAGVASAVGLGVAAGSGEATQRAQQAEATPEEVNRAATLGMIPGALEFLAPARILGRVRRLGLSDEVAEQLIGNFQKKIPSYGRRITAGALEEAAQEAASETAQNMIAQGIYAPETEILTGVGESATIGGIVGGLVSALIPGRDRGPGSTTDDNEVELYDDDGGGPDEGGPDEGGQLNLFDDETAPIPPTPSGDLMPEGAISIIPEEYTPLETQQERVPQQLTLEEGVADQQLAQQDRDIQAALAEWQSRRREETQPEPVTPEQRPPVIETEGPTKNEPTNGESATPQTPAAEQESASTTEEMSREAVEQESASTTEEMSREAVEQESETVPDEAPRTATRQETQEEPTPAPTVPEETGAQGTLFGETTPARDQAEPEGVAVPEGGEPTAEVEREGFTPRAREIYETVAEGAAAPRVLANTQLELLGKRGAPLQTVDKTGQKAEYKPGRGRPRDLGGPEVAEAEITPERVQEVDRAARESTETYSANPFRQGDFGSISNLLTRAYRNTMGKWAAPTDAPRAPKDFTAEEDAASHYFDSYTPMGALRTIAQEYAGTEAAADADRKANEAMQKRATAARKWVKANLGSQANKLLDVQERIFTREEASAQRQYRRVTPQKASETIAKKKAAAQKRREKLKQKKLKEAKEAPNPTLDKLNELEQLTAQKQYRDYMLEPSAIGAKAAFKKGIGEQIAKYNKKQKEEQPDKMVDIEDLYNLPEAAVAYSTLRIPKDVEQHLRNGNLTAALRRLSNAKNPHIAQAARALMANAGDTKVEFGGNLYDRNTGDPISGMFNPATNTIRLSSKEPVTIHTLLHEATHAAASHVIADPSNLNTQKLQQIFDDVQPYIESAYGSTDLQEFVAEAFSNPEFQAHLAAVTPMGKKLNIWQRFVNWLGTAVKWPAAREYLKKHSIETAYDAALDNINNILSPAPRFRNGTIMYNALATGKAGSLLARWFGGALGAVPKTVRNKSHEEIGGRYETMDLKGRQALFSALSLNNLIDMTKKRSPKMYEALEKFHVALRAHEGTRINLNKEHRATVKQAIRAFKGDPDARELLNDIAFTGTLEGVDAALDRNVPGEEAVYQAYSEEKQAIFKDLRAKYRKLTPEQQRAYKAIRDAYAAMNQKVIKAAQARLEATVSDQKILNNLKNQLFAKVLNLGEQTVSPYFPLYRKGKYWIKYSIKNPKEGGLDYEMMAFESIPKRREAIRKLREDSNVDADSIESLSIYDMLKNKRKATGLSTSDVKRLIDQLNVDSMPEAEKNTIYDMLFSTLPEQALLQGYRRRKGIGGFQDDLIGVFEQHMPSLINSYANVYHDVPLTEAKLEVESAAKDHPDDQWIQDMRVATVGAREETNAQFGGRPSYYEWIKNPYLSRWARVSKAGTFMYTLGFNVSSIVVNSTNIPIVAIPYYSGIYGAKTPGAFAEAMNLFTSSGFKRNAKTMDQFNNYTGEWTKGESVEKVAFLSLTNVDFTAPFDEQGKYAGYGPLAELMSELGLDTRTVITEMTQDDLVSSGEAKRGPLDIFTRFSRWSGTLFGFGERMNRQVAAMAGYKLEMQRLTKKDFKDISEAEFAEFGQKAAHRAVTLLEEANASALTSTGPRFAQSDIGSLLFMYRRYPTQMMYNQVKMFKATWNLMTRNIDPKDSEAIEEAKALRRALVMTYASAGMLAGVSGIPLYGIVSSLYDLAFTDDDEEDFNTIVAKAIGEGPYSGLVNHVFDVDISQRVALTNLLIRDRGNYEPENLFMAGVEVAAGPTVGISMNIANGIQQVLEGGSGTRRGIERMLPAFAANMLKSQRYYSEGALTMRGDPIVDQVSPTGLLGQFLGFTPAEYAKQLEINSYLKRVDRNISERRTKLLREYYMALRNQDTSAMRDIQEEISEFSRKHPEVAISSSSIRRSLMQHMRTSYIAEQLGGITLQQRRIIEGIRETEEFR